MFFKRKINKEEQIRKSLDLGMRLFHAGNRKESILPLKRVLEQLPSIPSYRLAAAILLAETYRGMGDFQFAESYYKLGLKECENVPIPQRPLNEWYNHYRPRAEIGLLFVMRRNLSTEHQTFSERIRKAKEELIYLNIPDLNAQLNLVEGLYFRQLGDIENSVIRIQDGVEELSGFSNSIETIFLRLEHFEALLILSYLIDPGQQILAARLAKKSLNEELSPWCMGVATLTLIHLTYRRMLDSIDENGNIDPGWIPDEKERLLERLSILNENAYFERDPLLISEGIILELIWRGLEKDGGEINRLLPALSKILEESCSATILLRTVELAAIYPLINQFVSQSNPVVRSLFETGIEKLTYLKPNLLTYNCQSDQIDYLFRLLKGDEPGQRSWQDWNSPSIQTLRSIAWP